MTVYRVYCSSYDGAWTLAVFGDAQEAIDYARDQARRSNEEFDGGTGQSVGIEILTPGSARELEDWQDWTVKMTPTRFVVVVDTDERAES